MHGEGVFIKADGVKYIGPFSSDKKTGVGAMLWPDGR
jgi:hypothetical protein